MRSLSLTRSSPAPVTRSSPPKGREGAEHRQFVDDAGHFVGCDLDTGRSRRRLMVSVPTGSPCHSAVALDFDRRAEPAQHLEHAGSGSGSGRRLRCALPTRQRRGGGGGEGRGGHVARNACVEAAQPLSALDRDAVRPSDSTCAPNAASARSV